MPASLIVGARRNPDCVRAVAVALVGTSVAVPLSIRASAPAVAGRSSGSKARAAATASSTCAGTSGQYDETRGAVSVNRRAISARALGEENGPHPQSISNTTVPSAYTSLRRSISSVPTACSGLM